jgi:hypothetical protein
MWRAGFGRSFGPVVRQTASKCMDKGDSPNVTTIMTGHGNIRSYVHRLKIIGSPECPCSHGIQTADRLVFRCERLKKETAILKSSELNVGKWPVSKSELTNRNLKQLINYINSMDFEKINQSNE